MLHWLMAEEQHQHQRLQTTINHNFCWTISSTASAAKGKLTTKAAKSTATETTAFLFGVDDDFSAVGKIIWERQF